MKVEATKSKACSIIKATQNVTHVIEQNGKCIAIFVDYKNSKQNAMHFSKCVNTHDEMLKALQNNAELIQWILDQKFDIWSDKHQEIYGRLAETKEVIKKATE